MKKSDMQVEIPMIFFSRPHCAHGLDFAFALGLDLALGQALAFGFPFSTALQATGRASAHGTPQDQA